MLCGLWILELHQKRIGTFYFQTVLVFDQLNFIIFFFLKRVFYSTTCQNVFFFFGYRPIYYILFEFINTFLRVFKNYVLRFVYFDK